MSKKYYMLEKSGKTVNIEIYGDITSLPYAENDVTSYGLARQIKGLTDVDVIEVGINSYGGEVSEGVAIYNALKNSPAKVVTRCDGFACSAASIVFAAGDERLMNESSLLMIHNAWTSVLGDANEMRKQADDLDKITELSVKAYMKIVKIDEEELRKLMDSETWIDPNEAVEMGFATGVYSTESDKVSQSIRRKVVQMIRNPYQLEEDPEKDPDNTDDMPETDTDAAETDPENPENDPEDPDKEPEQADEDPDADPENDPEDPDGESGEDTEDKDELAEQIEKFLRAVLK